jgi:hypothetical protein
MIDNEPAELQPSHKLLILCNIFKRKSIRPVLDEFTPGQLVESHAFLWDKLIEIHSLTQEKMFRREDVTKEMMASAAYQRQQGCDLRLDYCKGVECIWSNPVCAGDKVKNNMDVMAKTVMRYLDSAVSRQESNLKERRRGGESWALELSDLLK